MFFSLLQFVILLLNQGKYRPDGSIFQLYYGAKVIGIQ